MRAALAVLGSKMPRYGGRRVAILGDMLELGADGPCLHASLLDHLVAAKPDLVITIGSLMRELYDKIPPTINCLHADRSIDVSEKISDELRAGDLILIKGSLGMNMAPIVSAIENMKSNSPFPYRSFESGDSQNAV
jgi:UDP-N-acetylmuramoyl-tripeptide--D-alanyl-D-alanine ligase